MDKGFRLLHKLLWTRKIYIFQVMEYKKLFHLILQVIVDIKVEPVSLAFSIIPNRTGILIQSKCYRIPRYQLCA